MVVRKQLTLQNKLVVIYIIYIIHRLVKFVYLDLRKSFVTVGEMGTPRKAKPIDLPVMFAQPKVHDASEIDNKMKEIMRLSGVLCIDGKVIYFYLA